MEPDKKLYVREHDNKDKELDTGQTMHSLPKLNVVRRINFDNSDEGAKKDTKNLKIKSPKKGSDRIRFMQNLKQEIDNAKCKTPKVADNRYDTRSSVKKRSEESDRLTLLGLTATETEKNIKNKEQGKSTIKKHSSDSRNVQGTIDFKHVTNINPTLEQNQTFQLTIRDHTTPGKLYTQSKKIERPITRSMTKKSPDYQRSKLHTSEDMQLDTFKSELQRTDLDNIISDPETKVVSDFPREHLETNVLQNVTPEKFQDPNACECSQVKTLDNVPDIKDDQKSIVSKNEDVSIAVSPFNIEMQEELDNQPVLRDQEFTDFIHEKFRRMEIDSKGQTQQQNTFDQKDGYCSSGCGSFEQYHTQIVEAMIHSNESRETCVEKDFEMLQPHHLNISEASVPKVLPNAEGNGARSTQSASPLLLTDSQIIQEQKVTMLRHSSLLDYLGILKTSDDTSQPTYLKETAIIPETVDTVDEVDTTPMQTFTSLVNCSEQEVTKLRHSTTQDYLEVSCIKDGVPQRLPEKIIKPKLLNSEILDNNLQPIQPLSESLSEKQRSSKIMKKKDFFNKENKVLPKYLNKKQVTVIDSQVIVPASQTSLTCLSSTKKTSPIILSKDLTEENEIHTQKNKKTKAKSKQQKIVLSTLQEVNLNDIVNITDRKSRKRKLSASADLDVTQVLEETNGNNTKKARRKAQPINSKQARAKADLKDGETEQMQNKSKLKKIKTEKMTKTAKKRKNNTETEIKPDRILTRKRKKQMDEIELEELGNKELRIVITPTFTQTSGSELLSDEQKTNDSNQQGDMDAIEVIEEYIDCDIQEDKQTDAEIEKHFLRKRDAKKKYIDFLSDNEDFEWSSSSWEGSCESDTDTETGVKKNKKKKKKIDDNICKNIQNSNTDPLDLTTKKKRFNRRVQTQSAKEKGEAYTTRRGSHVSAKYVKENPCSRDNCNHGCFNITEERRQNLFRHYWSLSSTRKRDWLISNSNRIDIKRKRTQGLSRRSGTFQYFINEGEGKKEICLKFLIKTLDIRQKYLHNTLSACQLGSSKDDLRGKHQPANKTHEELIHALKLYLANLPVLPSHYCRKNSSKLYLPEGFRNLSNLYRIYKEAQTLEGKATVGEKVFRAIYKRDFNYGFHVPRKDKCVQCLKYENDKSPAMEEIQKRHLKDKEETYNRFKAHQNIHSKDNSILCVSFDLQKVLNTPFGKSILLFYYRKLSVYNFTFYECGTKEGHCYTWNETEGKRGANEICSILELYIKKIDDMGTIKHLLFYSDCCPGQNRNKTVISCVQKCLEQCKNLDTIQLNYLLPGHTYMPVDSMHSVIEKSVKHATIWTPAQWPTVFSLARKHPKPYEVNVMTHKEFMDWDSLLPKEYQKRLTGKISKLRIVTFKRSMPRTLFVKYSMHPEAKVETIDMPKLKHTGPKRAYKSKLPISKKKQEDLNKMCSMNIIPEIYHNDYLNLHFSNTLEDVLEDTDIEDLIEEQ